MAAEPVPIDVPLEGGGKVVLYENNVNEVVAEIGLPGFTSEHVKAISACVANQERLDHKWKALGAELRGVFGTLNVFSGQKKNIETIIVNALSEGRRNAYNDENLPRKKQNVDDAPDIALRRLAKKNAQTYVAAVYNRLQDHAFPPPP